MQALTDLILKRTPRPLAGKRMELTDARCRGLVFRITDKDVRSFSFRFRDPKTGRPGRVTVGPYPAISLSQARQRADALRAEVATGINPAEQHRRRRSTAASRTFSAVADRYMEEHARRHKRPSSAAGDANNLRLHVLPKWKHRAIDGIERRDVIELVEGLIARGTPVLANRVQALISKIFSFAVDADVTKNNPCVRLKRRGAERTGDRVLSDDEIRQFWPRCMLSPVSPKTGLALRLALLTAARAGEVAGMRRSELTDLEHPGRALWLIPGSRTKNARDHAIPLSDLARETINGAVALSGSSEFVFASGQKRRGAIHSRTLTQGMERLGAAVGWKVDAPSPHDLRRTVATRLASMGTSREDVSAVLGHVRSDVTGRHYDKYDRLNEKRRALEAWEGALRFLVFV